MPSGNGAQFALAKIGSLYTSVDTANLWQNFTSESLEHTLSELEEASINGSRDAPPSYKGLDTGKGDINFEPNPNALTHFFKAWFGTHVASTVTAAGSLGANSSDFAGYAMNYHSFTPRNAAWEARSFLEPYNVMMYRDVGSAWLFRGAIFHTLKLNIQAEQLVKATASVMARDVGRIQRIAAIQSLVSSGGRPWVWDMASIEISSSDTTSAGLSAATDFEAINITFDLPHDGLALLDGTKKYAEFQPSDFRRIKVDGTVSFRDQSEYDTFIAYEARRMRITMVNVNSKLIMGNPASKDASVFLGYPGMRIHAPQLKFLTWSAPITGPNRITANFTAKMERSDVDGFSCKIELLNIVSSTDVTQTY
jgi:hypothetical protein